MEPRYIPLQEVERGLCGRSIGRRWASRGSGLGGLGNSGRCQRSGTRCIFLSGRGDMGYSHAYGSMRVLGSSIGERRRAQRRGRRRIWRLRLGGIIVTVICEIDDIRRRMQGPGGMGMWFLREIWEAWRSTGLAILRFHLRDRIFAMRTGSRADRTHARLRVPPEFLFPLYRNRSLWRAHTHVWLKVEHGLPFLPTFGGRIWLGYCSDIGGNSASRGRTEGIRHDRNVALPIKFALVHTTKHAREYAPINHHPVIAEERTLWV